MLSIWYIYLYYNDFWLQVYCGVSVSNPNRCGDGVSPVVNSTTDTSYKQTVSLCVSPVVNSTTDTSYKQTVSLSLNFLI
jgi:hypothetical protein